MRCPVCRADNGMEPSCRRCKADLSLMVALERQRERALADAWRAVVSGDAAAAEEKAGTAQALRSGPDTSRVLALAALLRRDFARAMTFHRRSVFSPEGAQ